MPPKSVWRLSAQNLSRVYQCGSGRVKALDDVSLDINKGEFIAVTGRSGSGKTTLINMLAGLDRASEGTIQTADGTKINKLDEEELARWRGRNVGIVFQFYQLLPSLTVLENTLLPMDLCGVHPKVGRRDHAMSLLNDLGINEHASKLPRDLSGGQQQRAAIARALVNDPDVVFADEPTGNLDSTTAMAVMELFAAQAAKGKAVIMVTHDLDLAPYFSRIITLGDGRIVAEKAKAA
ncbi:Lipoprotein-releasing system ATP-binding protein LolD [Roseibium album]|nr:Lipoprotein-releasing system ATP-binding protein LolD [Roseibium album]